MSLERTHVVGVLSVVLHDDRILLLKRRKPPIKWAPPGGRLRADENPVIGMTREIAEECGISVRILGPFDTWQGVHEGMHTLGIIYIGLATEIEVTLSDEHSAARWFTIEEIECMYNETPSELFGTPYLYLSAQRVAVVLRELA